MKKFYYSFLIIVIISIAIKVSINHPSSNNCIDFPNLCASDLTCVNLHNEYSCSKVDQVEIKQKLVNEFSDSKSKYYQYDVSVTNKLKNVLHGIRISTDCNLHLKEGLNSIWNIDRFPNGDLIIKENQPIYPNQTYNFGFIISNQIPSDLLKLKSISVE